MILPMIDVPVSLVGTFAVMAAMGFSLNNLTLFGLVLAIGIVVDDAIMVLENIERLMATGLDARTATIKAMDELTGPIVAITLVLSSVFLPSCFVPGLTGQFYRQFALTIAASVIISAVNAMTLTPSRAVSIFGPRRRARAAGGKRGPTPPEERSPPLVDLRDRRRAAHRLADAAFPGRPPGPAGGPCRGSDFDSEMALLGRHVCSRPAGRPRGRLVPHRSRQRRPRLVLPRIQPPVRRHHRGLWLDRGEIAAPERHRPPDLRRPARADLVAHGERTDRLHSHARSGLSGRQRPVAGLRLAAADRGGPGPDRPDRPRHPRRGPHRRHRRGIFLLRLPTDPTSARCSSS